MITAYLDIETTGLPPRGKDVHYSTHYEEFPRIVQIGLLKDDGISKGWELTVNVEGYPIPDEVVKIHGITPEISAASRYTIAEVLLFMLEDLRGVDRIIGYNLYFDTSIIKANAIRIFGLDSDTYKAIEEALHKDKRLDLCRGIMHFTRKMMSKDKLMGLTFGSALDGRHSALSDCRQTKELFDHHAPEGNVKWKGEIVYG